MHSFEYCPELLRLLQVGAQGRSGKLLTGASLSTPNNLAVLRSLLLARRPERTLEVGLALGGSALVFAATHRDLGRSPTGQHVAIDPHQESVWDAAGLAAIERAGLSSFLSFRSEPSALALGQLLQEGATFDVCYVDGSHLFEDVFVDWYFISRLIAHQGLILLDDCTYPDVRKVLRFVRRNLRSSFTEVDLAPHRGDGTCMRYQLARWLGRAQLRAFVKTGDATRAWNERFVDF